MKPSAAACKELAHSSNPEEVNGAGGRLKTNCLDKLHDVTQGEDSGNPKILVISGLNPVRSNDSVDIKACN